MSCQTILHENACIEAEITIEPHVTVDEVSCYCLGNPAFDDCPGTITPTCSFRVSQDICVQIPVTFSATVTAEPLGIVCEDPGLGVCVLPTACTYTIGYFKNHPDLTNALITGAGGSIVLGITGTGTGLSYTVTTANANSVLDLDTESPPAPEDPPFANQYQVLYAQLLAANLNMLNGAICSFAANAIAQANTFLANSPEGGMAGAPFYQTPLAQYNEGMGPGCPVHCPDDVYDP